MSNPHNIAQVVPEMAALIVGLNEAWEEDYSLFAGGIDYYETLFQTALTFCLWADANVNFAKHDTCWPYYREDVAPVLQEFMAEHDNHRDNFTTDHAKTVAERLKLPLIKSTCTTKRSTRAMP
jgi:hypothetical protein